jgi:hypothetical protein
MSFLTKALTLDRRWIFLAIGVQELLGQSLYRKRQTVFADLFRLYNHC